MFKKNIALSSMALLGLTKAQLWIDRSKTFTVHSVTPMNRLLTLVDSGNDDIRVSVECVDDESDYPGNLEIGPYNYYFNDVTRDDIGQRFCPVATQDTSPANKRSFDEGDDWKTNCISQLSEMPVFDNSQASGVTHEIVDGAGSPVPWTEPAGGITCAPDHQVNITIYNRYESDVSMTYNLDTWQYACIEDDFLSIFFEFGKRETFEGKDLCFANEEYLDAQFDPPFVVNNNCYGPDHDPQWNPDDRHDSHRGEPISAPGFNYWECHHHGYRVDLHVIDNEEANEYYGKVRRIREPYMWVQVDFHRVKDYFQIFPEDKARISFHKGQDANPSSVTVSPFEIPPNVCDPDRAADEIICENLSVFCTSPDDTVNLRIAAAGELLMYDSSNTCAEIVAGAFDYETMQAAINDDPETYALHLGEQFLYHVEVNDQEEGAYSNAWFSFSYGTYHRSNAEICFTGDFFPYQSPSCTLHNSGLPVSTQIHNPHEYAMDQFVMEIVLNSDYEPFSETEPTMFNIGGNVDLTNQLSSAIQGYVELGKLDDAIATSITIESLPACGALYRQTESEEEEQFAIFWSYDQVSGFVVQAQVGDEIDFSMTSLFYDATSDDCGALEDQFTYTVMGSVPVEGPTTTAGLQVVETLYAYDGFGLEPSVVDGDASGLTIQINDMAPYGAEVGRCATPDCSNGNVEMLELDTDYDPYHGWYFIQTTASSYDAEGNLNDDLWAWLYGQFCVVIPECSGTLPPTIVSMQGVSRHPDASHTVTFDDHYDDTYGSLMYCMAECYDMSISGWSVDGYDGATTYGPVQIDTDYDVGSSAGQFMFQQTSDQAANFAALDGGAQTAYWVAVEQFMYVYFNWFGATAALGDDGPTLDYTMADVVSLEFVPQPEDGDWTVTFDSYPPRGWLGQCTVADCAGQTPSGIITGYEYDAYYYYFVFYATSDAMDGEGNLDADMTAWAETYFTWLSPPEPALPDSSAVGAILNAIGAAGAPLTVTLLWNAQVDLDLYFACDDGSDISYQNTNNEACGGTLDHDAVASGYNVERYAGGSLGQVENISVQNAVDGHEYGGRVNYYSGGDNAEFQVIFSGTDAEGVLHVYGQAYVAEFTGAGSNHAYSFVYTN